MMRELQQDSSAQLRIGSKLPRDFVWRAAGHQRRSDHDCHDGDVLGKPKPVACAAAPLPVTSGAGAAAVADIGTIGDPAYYPRAMHPSKFRWLMQRVVRSSERANASPSMLSILFFGYTGSGYQHFLPDLSH